MNPNNLNLYIVDDDEAVRRSLGSLLLSRLSDCSIKTFESGEAFLQNANLDGSGIAILDLRMEGMSGLDVFQTLQELKSPLVVVFLSGHGDIPVAVRAMQEGAISWLEKPCSDAVLLATIQKAKELAASVATMRRNQQVGVARWIKLTPRERQVAPLVATGKSSKEIARILSNQTDEVEHRTVETHRAKIFAKLEVANSNELLIFLRDHALAES
jgi:FixJ family two-component response regulator